MIEDVLIVGAGPTRDPDGSKLRALLQTQFALERAQSFRDLFVYLLALASLPLGYLVARPATRAGNLRPITLAGWLTCLAALVVAALWEGRCRRRNAALRRHLPPP
jgi:hypothetical protein